VKTTAVSQCEADMGQALVFISILSTYFEVLSSICCLKAFVLVLVLKHFMKKCLLALDKHF